MALARKLEVDQVVLFHHDPYHTDDELEELLASAKERCNVHGGKVCLAREGMTVTFDEAGVAITY